MRIAVIGTGNVGATLGRRWAENGHEVEAMAWVSLAYRQGMGPDFGLAVLRRG